MQMPSDKLFQTDTEVAKVCISNTKALVDPSGNDTKIIDEITSTLQQPTDKICSKVHGEKMWSELHKLHSKDTYCKK